MSAPALNLVSWGLQPGTVLLGRFRVEEKIGEGAVASVYRARELGDERQVALKILDPLRVTDPVSRERFRRELSALGAVHHRGLARAFELGSEGDLEILVLELIEGERLDQRSRRGPLPVEEAVQIATQIAEAVGACHAQGILHRDLKPANVILHPERGAVVLDFGLAWFSAAANLTRTGAILGTPQYMAPEALRSALADPRSDLYSIAAILFELVAGRPVYLSTSTDALVADQAREPPPRLFTLRADVGPGLSAVVERALSARPEQRFATAAELIEALRGRSSAPQSHLDLRLSCSSCRSARIVHLPFCPGCGEPVAWTLEPGPFALRLDSVANVEETAAWLEERHRAALRLAQPARRLRFLPAPLVVGVSQTSARQLMAEAAQIGASTTLIHTSRMAGPRLSATPVRLVEVAAVFFLHALIVLALAVLGVALGVSPYTLYFLPPLVAILMLLPVWRYVRIPILRAQRRREVPAPDPAFAGISGALGRLHSDQGRRLATAAIARYAPFVLEADPALRAQRAGAEAAVFKALAAIRAAETHLQRLMARPRSALAHELSQAEARAATGDADAVSRRAELLVEKRTLAEIGAAHDLEVRAALQAISEISLASADEP